MKLDGCIALVFGGARRGMGKEFCRALLSQGAKVMLCDVLEEEGRLTTSQLAQTYGEGRILFQKCDVTKEEDIAAAYARVKEAFGPPDVILNHAGTMHEGRWKWMLDVNISGVVHSTREAIKQIGRCSGGKGGVIVNTASLAAVKPLAVWAPLYSASKAAVLNYTRVMSSGLQLASHGIRMMCLCPSTVDTDMVTECHKRDRVEFFEEQQKWLQLKRKEGFIQPETVADILMDMLRRDEELNGAAAVIEGNTPEFLYVTSGQ